MEELESPHTQQGQGGADLVAPIMEQLAAMKLATPIMEEPPDTKLTSLGSAAHNDDDPRDEGLWSTAASSTDAESTHGC